MPLDPSYLPNLSLIRQRAQALAMIDAIICPEWDSRYYSYNSAWSQEEEMASMRDGSGDGWFLLFGAFGAAIKGLAHESELAEDAGLSAEVRVKLPDDFASFLQEPAFGWDQMSFCYWLGTNDKTWNRVSPPNTACTLIEDGSTDLLAMLYEPAEAYVEFAKWYYEVSVPLKAVESIFCFEPLTAELVTSINPELSLAAVTPDAKEIAYPIMGNATDLKILATATPVAAMAVTGDFYVNRRLGLSFRKPAGWRYEHLQTFADIRNEYDYGTTDPETAAMLKRGPLPIVVVSQVPMLQSLGSSITVYVEESPLQPGETLRSVAAEIIRGVSGFVRDFRLLGEPSHGHIAACETLEYYFTFFYEDKLGNRGPARHRTLCMLGSSLLYTFNMLDLPADRIDSQADFDLVQQSIELT